MQPANAVAEAVVKLQSENEVLMSAIEHQQATVTKNQATIAELEPLAEWTEEPVDPTV